MIQINDNINVYYDLKYKPRQEQIDSLKYIQKSINSSASVRKADIEGGKD